MDEYEIKALKNIVDDIDRDIVLDNIPNFSTLKQLVSFVDSIDFSFREDLDKYEDVKEKLHDVSWNLDQLSDSIDNIGEVIKEIKKIEQAFDDAGIQFKFNINLSKNLEESYDNLTYFFTKIEDAVEDY